MRIAYFGKFERPWRTENYVSFALEKLGHTVDKFDFSTGIRYRRTYQLLKANRPDLILCSKASESWLPRLLKWASHERITSVTWAWDLFWGFRSRRLIPPHFFKTDYLFTTDGGNLERWREAGLSHHVLLRQGIHRPEANQRRIPSGPNPKFEHDVAFVGSKETYKHRYRLVNWLEATYGEKFIHHTYTRGDDLNRALARVKVVVGDSYPSPNYWSNRIYEITGRGGFILHPSVPGLETEFTPGEHFGAYDRPEKFAVPADGFHQLRETIDYWLRDNDRREAVRTQGFTHTRNNYTYEHRVERLLHYIQHEPSRKSIRD